jgi:hypothetical protein
MVRKNPFNGVNAELIKLAIAVIKTHGKSNFIHGGLWYEDASLGISGELFRDDSIYELSVFLIQNGERTTVLEIGPYDSLPTTYDGGLVRQTLRILRKLVPLEALGVTGDVS